MDKYEEFKDFEAASKLGVKKDEYTKSYKYENNVIHVGMDDYGQSYFLVFEYKGEVKELGCGTYCDYWDALEYVFEEMLSSK